MASDVQSNKAPARGGFVFGALLSLPGWLWIAIALLPAVFIYSPVWQFDYVWDDRAFFVNTTSIRQGNLLDVLTQPVLIGTAYFRPFVMLWFAAETRLLQNPLPWAHLGNMALAIGNAFLVGLLVLRLAGAERESLAARLRAVSAALLYVFHPALIEPTAWVSGRFDLAVTFFCLLALWLFSSERLALVMASGLAFLLAALSKEMAAVLPILAFLFVWAVRSPDAPLVVALRACFRRPAFIGWLCLSAGAILYLLMRLQFIHVLQVGDPALDSLLSTVWLRIAFVGHSIALYVRITIWPFKDLGPLHPFDVSALTTGDVVIGCLYSVVALATVVLCICKPGRARLLLAASLLALLPVINIVPLTIVGNLGHERFLTLPLAMAVLAVVHVPIGRLQLSVAMRERLPALLGIAFALWSAVAVLNVRVTLPLWRDELTLWRWAYSLYPDQQFVQFSLAAAALRTSNNQLANEVLTRAEARGPLPLRLMIPYGQYLIRMDRAEEGVAKIQQSLAGEAQPHLAVLAKGGDLLPGQVDKSERAAWYLVYVYTVLAEGHINLRQFPQAEQDAKTILYYQADNATGLVYKAIAAYGLDRWDDAERQFAIARQAYPSDSQAAIDKMRVDFLGQLCRLPDRAPSVCEHVARDVHPARPIAR